MIRSPRIAEYVKIATDLTRALRMIDAVGSNSHWCGRSIQAIARLPGPISTASRRRRRAVASGGTKRVRMIQIARAPRQTRQRNQAASWPMRSTCGVLRARASLNMDVSPVSVDSDSPNSGSLDRRSEIPATTDLRSAASFDPGPCRRLQGRSVRQDRSIS